MDHTAIRVTDLFKEFTTDQGQVNAVQGISLEVPTGHFFTLLGPSGCGKSTTLRCIAGLERPDGGTIQIEDMVVVSTEQRTFVPTHRRPIGMVFQSYAIWPHMDVFENVAFPLTRGSVRFPRAVVQEKVMRALALVQLDGLERRPAPQLSGGQQQRLALARALVREPKALLLDEPLSNLDAKLRDEMRVELKQLTARLGITTLFVTHDQLEALTLSDQIAIMQEGHIVQLGSPREIYADPQSRFAAQFIGTTNLFEGSLSRSPNGYTTVSTPNGTLRCAPPRAGQDLSGQVSVAVRPENIRLSKAPPEGQEGDYNYLKGTVETLVYLGDALDCRVRVGEQLVRASVHPSTLVDEGDTLYLTIAAEDCKVLPPDLGPVKQQFVPRASRRGYQALQS